MRHLTGWLLSAMILACTRLERRAAGDRAPPPPPETAADTAPRILTPSGPADSALAWEALAAAVRRRAGEIRAVTESRSRRVTVHFRDGSSLRSVEPEPGAMRRLVKEVDPAGEILVATD